MLGNIWLSSVLIVTAIFLTSSLYKAYSDVQDAKQIQEQYEIISEIKTLMAIQYNKNPKDVTIDEIIVHLPNGVNWEKVLLLDRKNKDGYLSNNGLVNSSADFVISEEEKLKLLAVKVKLKNLTNITNITPDANTKKYTFHVGEFEKNIVLKDVDIEKSVNKAIYILSVDILYSGESITTSFLDTKLQSIIDEFTPYDKMYQDFKNSGETTISDTELVKRKKDYFKSKIKEKLALNETATETRLYLLLKDK